MIMAEPMSTNEIEDVLSSIRRLVAQDLKPADRAKLAAVADETQKLILAPEQRIEDGPTKFATVRRPSRRAAFPPVDMVLAGVAAAAEGGPRGTATGNDWPAGPSTGVAEQLAKSDAPADFAAIAAEFDAAPRHITPPPAGEMTEFAVDPQARLYDAAPEEFPPAPSANADQVTWQDGEAEFSSAQDFAMDSDGDSYGAAQDTNSLQGNIEPDSAWADEAERRVIEELSGKAAEEVVFAQAKDSFREPNFGQSARQAEPEVLFDEDVLRAMVQAILRDEMAGAMGERITRNIRKLVRAEVGRMLAAQELE